MKAKKATKKVTAKKVAKKVTAKKAVRTRAPKLVANASVIKNGKIYCVNHTENTTPFWGGKQCDNHMAHDGDLVRWTCADCVAKAMPAPAPRRQSVPRQVDPETGTVVKRQRGRPRKNPPKPVLLDENGQPIKRPRGRPKGVKNKKTTEREKNAPSTPKRPRGRPKGSTKKVVAKKAVTTKKVKKTTTTSKKK